MPYYAIDGIRPVVHPNSYVHPTAVIIGDVIIGDGCYVGPNAVLRGDFGRLILEEGANLQDTCVMHGFPNTDTIVERNGHIGHGAVLHGCRIGENALIGMNSVIMDGAVVGHSSIVAAMSFVKANMRIEPRQLVVGAPARVIRTLSDQEIAWKESGTMTYHQLALRSQATLVETVPLNQIDRDRQRHRIEDAVPLYQFKTIES